VPELALALAQKAAQLFGERGIDNARLEAELLLAHVLGIKRLDLYLQHDRPVTQQQLEDYRAFVRRRLKREPLQYITGRVQFRHVELKVDRRALIPRPETELLVGEVVKFARAAARPLRILDIGVGSGAIALSLAHEVDSAHVVATDVSDDAISLAQENAAELNVDVEFRVGELLGTGTEMFDVVVSNPPYVAEQERADLQPEVKDWEPASALFGGADGLDIVRAIITRSPARLTGSGLLALEIGMTQAAEVSAAIEATSSFENVKVIRDLAGRDRIVTAVRKQDS
jgi:release factor glutamine methyltransferase